MANLEQTVLETFRKLSPGKQQEVLEFLTLLEQSSQPSEATAEELAKAHQIITKGLERAKATPPLSSQEIWSKFEQVRGKISSQYQEKLQSS
jgi:hypothetical protein